MCALVGGIMKLPILRPGVALPAAESALRDPNGLLAIGGDLSVERLTEAYRNGIFPWFSEGDPILWWSPDPRAVFMLETLELPTSLRKFVRKCRWQLSVDMAFTDVIQGCADSPRPGQDGTWITAEMIAAYVRLHQHGVAHSVEVWADDRLIGGIYGIAIGRLFFGESMFSRRSNASKVALFALARHLHQHDYLMLDSQVPNPHTLALGAVTMPRQQFLALLRRHIDEAPHGAPWRAGYLRDACTLT